MVKRSTRRLNINYPLDLDLHTTTNNFAPNEYREVVNLSGPVVYKGSKHKGKILVVIAAEIK